MQGSQYNEEDPHFAFFMPNQGAPQVVKFVEPQTDKVDERICALEEKLKAMVGSDTPRLDAFDI